MRPPEKSGVSPTPLSRAGPHSNVPPAAWGGDRLNASSAHVIPPGRRTILEAIWPSPRAPDPPSPHVEPPARPLASLRPRTFDISRLRRVNGGSAASRGAMQQVWCAAAAHVATPPRVLTGGLSQPSFRLLVNTCRLRSLRLQAPDASLRRPSTLRGSAKRARRHPAKLLLLAGDMRKDV